MEATTAQVLAHLHAFGRESFRPGQEKVVRHLLAARDGLAVLPTGSGTSLAYQLAARFYPAVTIVVSPPIAQTRYQVGAVDAHGLDVGAANTLSPRRRLGRRRAMPCGADSTRCAGKPSWTNAGCLTCSTASARSAAASATSKSPVGGIDYGPQSPLATGPVARPAARGGAQCVAADSLTVLFDVARCKAMETDLVVDDELLEAS